MTLPASQAENEPIFAKARAAIVKKLRNLQFAQFQNLERLTTPNVKGIPTDVICGKIKILSSSGGNVSLRPFVYFVGDETAYYDSGMPDADLDALIVKNFCAD